MNEWLITSGYTMKSGYFKDLMGLFDSAQKLGIYFEAMPFYTFGTWRANANYKGSLVLSALKRHPSLNVVWVDADAALLNYPALFDTIDADIAVYFAQWPLHKPRRTCSNGTMFFRNTSEVQLFVKQWANWSLKHPAESQQDYFGRMFDETAIKKMELPPEYCMVVAPDPVPDAFKPWITKPGPIRSDVSIEDVVIMHTWGGARHGGSTPKK